ncbi:hypothetical protein [Nisaea nitritireducens]|uniref:hypothetical protein n=1 Tax=Nisaea nitritireducens TaxID=568392 RepID=UPI001D025368|nr:hypothetical protein [Nisaea nitritireducens]
MKMHSHHHHPHHHHDHAHDHAHDHPHDHGHGHNSPPQAASQWQTPHLPHDAHDHGHDPEISDERKDLDLVEQAFVEGFHASSDPTSFLRLANIPFSGKRGSGKQDGGNVLHLLRVEQSRETNLGSVTPVLGGGSFRYAPLPAKMASQQDRLNFLYLDGEQVVKLSLDEARALQPEHQEPAKTD